MEIANLNLSQLRNDEHCQLHIKVIELIEKYGTKKLNVETAYNEYTTLLLLEQEALRLTGRSVSARQLAEADFERDLIYKGLIDAVKSNRNHFNGIKAASAERVLLLLQRFGNMAQKGYYEETAAINKLTQAATGEHIADFTLLQLNEWMKELTDKNKTFEVLLNSRVGELWPQTDLRMKQVRPLLDNAFRTLVNRLNALMLVFGATHYTPFVKEMNACIEKYNLLITQRQNQLSKAELMLN